MRICDKCKTRIPDFDSGFDFGVEIKYKPEPIGGYTVRHRVTDKYELCEECSRKVKDKLYKYIRQNKES